MRYFVGNVAFLLLIAISGYAQRKRVPKDIKQAIRFLDIDCSDGLKSIIKETANTDLKKLSYPWGGNYKTIYSWTHGDNKESQIVKYLAGKGIHSNQEIVILIAFREYLLGQQVNEAAIYEPWLGLEKKNTEEDKVRFTTDSLSGIYIPVDLEDCFKQIDGFWNDSTKVKVKQMTEDEFSARVHLGFGMWIRNNWQLWGGSRLSRYFNVKGIHHPDDMSGIILDSYHRHLNNQEIKLDEQIKHYQDYWDKVKVEELAKKEEEFEAYKVGDTLKYTYRHGYLSKEQEKKEANDICIAQCVVLEKKKDNYLLKIRLLKSCDRRGIIIYDNKDVELYDPITKKWSKPKKKIKKRIRIGQSYWSDYSDWYTTD